MKSIKKVLRKITAVFIAVVLCICSLQCFVTAESNLLRIEIESKTCYPGEKVTINLNVTENPGLMYLNLTPQFNAALGTPAITNGSLISNFQRGSNCLWDSENDVNGTGVLGSIEFTVPADIAPGEYPVNFIFRESYNYDEESVVCQITSGKITVLEKEDESGTNPEWVIGNGKAKPGSTVSVDVSVKNNPGFNAFSVTFDYDKTRLELVSVVPTANLIGTFNYVKKATFVGSGDYTDDSAILTLTFNVLSNAEDGVGYISASYEEGDICNYDEDDVNFDIIDGGVTVYRYTPGDINDDGKVNTKDLTRLVKYFSGEEVEVNEYALDVNGDGKVNTKDLTRLVKYLSGEEVEIH